MTSLVAAALGRRLRVKLRGLVAVSKMQLQLALGSRFRCLPWLRPSHNALPQTTSVMTTLESAGGPEKLMLFSEQSGDQDSTSGSSGSGERKSGPLKLMDYKKLRWPNPFKVFRNYIFAALIQISFDKEFSMNSFLAGAGQVIWPLSKMPDFVNHNF